MKRCSTCKTEKPFLEFSKYKSSRDGLQPNCKACAASYRNAYKKHHPEKIREYSVRHNQIHNGLRRERLLASPEAREEWNRYKRESWERNREAELARNAEYRKRKPEKGRARGERHRLNNPHMYRAYAAGRRARELQATPGWADQKKIAEFYFAAEFLRMVTGEWYHVDHIVPLLGPVARFGPFKGERLVQGLHCEANLAVIPMAENLAKKNRHWPDMP